MDEDRTDFDMDDLESGYSCTCKLCWYTCSCVCKRRAKGSCKEKKPKVSKKKESKSSIFRRSGTAHPQGQTAKVTALQRAKREYEKLGQDNEKYLLKDGEHCEKYDSEGEDENLVKRAPSQNGSIELGPVPVPETQAVHSMKCEESLPETQHEFPAECGPLKESHPSVEADTESVDPLVYNYNMSHKHRGRTLILLQSEIYPYIDPKYKGVCTDHLVEADVLKTLFTSLGFVVEVKDCGACKSGDIQKVLSKVAKDDHSDADCFVSVILGHGGNQELYCTNTTLEVEELTTFFKGDRCPSLAGKPKLFFVQFCQGQEIALSQVVTDGVVCDSSSDGPTRIPSEADFMVSLATVPGELSPGNSKVISPYVLALSETLTNNYADADLLRMMTYVNYAIMKENECMDSKNEQMELEIPQIMTTLTKDLYFPPQPLTVPGPAPASVAVCVECDMDRLETEL
ncbi:caspase-1-like [Lineus longissimus]|uniref:caspase-1-like n=1 Tax=Lineus longissimus TaxID=88925 RepID=UPI00315DB0F9